MNSKNIIWLSSFFSLLFITFCVTRHLDDLNPNIINMPRESQEINAELGNVDLHSDIQDTVSPSQKRPLPNNQKPTSSSTKELKEEKTTMRIRVVKQTQTDAKKKNIKSAKVIITESYIINDINLDSFAIKSILKNEKNQKLNKLAYLHQMNKDSIIHIYTDDKAAATLLANYLQRENVKKRYIQISLDEKVDNLIKITLTGRK